MIESVINTKSLPDVLFRFISTEKVRVLETGGVIQLVPVEAESGIKIGDALAAIGRRSQLTNDDFEVFEKARYENPAEPMRFE